MKLPDLSGRSRGFKIAVLVAAAVAFLAVCALVGWACMPVYRALQDPANQAAFEGWVGSLGVLGVAVMLLVQVVQIVVAFIPGEVVQVLAGAMYGTWGGLALCLAGCVVASACVFAVIRHFGRGLVVRLFGEDRLDSFGFLDDSERLETLVFVLFLIPGMPKDVLTYIVPLSNIRLGSFLFLSTVARIPGMVASTLVGSSIADANWPLIIGVFAVVAVLGLLCIWKKDGLMAWAKRVGGVRPAAGE
jgi:uncharacterized membrane protein YdjX (TVP38/TMEM64 family)